MPTTEFAVIPLKAGSDIGNPDNPTASVVNDCLATLRATDGMQQIHFGTKMEDASHLQLMITWEDIKNHHDFMASDAYGPFMKKFGSILDGDVTIVHADFKPEGAALKAFSAPVTEVLTLYFDDEPPSDYLNSVGEAAKSVEGSDGFLGFAAGITHEEIEKDGVKGKGAVVLGGWQSLEAHKAFRETKAFKDVVGTLRSTSKGPPSVWHVQFMKSV